MDPPFARGLSRPVRAATRAALPWPPGAGRDAGGVTVGAETLGKRQRGDPCPGTQKNQNEFSACPAGRTGIGRRAGSHSASSASRRTGSAALTSNSSVRSFIPSGPTGAGTGVVGWGRTRWTRTLTGGASHVAGVILPGRGGRRRLVGAAN